MAQEKPPPGTGSDLDFADTLWQAADKLRGTVDAAEYKHVVRGLLFLKYVSDAFEARREALRAELGRDGIQGAQLERLLESRDEYTAENVFWVPPEARWANLRARARQPNVAVLIDDAILAVEHDNPTLKNKLPRDYACRGIPHERMAGLIDLISNIEIGERSGTLLRRLPGVGVGDGSQAETKTCPNSRTPLPEASPAS